MKMNDSGSEEDVLDRKMEFETIYLDSKASFRDEFCVRVSCFLSTFLTFVSTVSFRHAHAPSSDGGKVYTISFILNG